MVVLDRDDLLDIEVKIFHRKLDTGTWSSGDKSGPRCKYESCKCVVYIINAWQLDSECRIKKERIPRNEL